MNKQIYNNNKNLSLLSNEIENENSDNLTLNTDIHSGVKNILMAPRRDNENENEITSINNIITPCLVVNKESAPMTKQWNNGIYSYNSNFVKNLPSTDNMVNKLIRSYFSINPIAYNPKGKKSRLLQRRFKRLSLNKILVSKPEVKHTNEKVNITVHVFNKKKISLEYKLKKLYREISSTKKESLKPLRLAKMRKINNRALASRNKNNFKSRNTSGNERKFKSKILSRNLYNKIRLLAGGENIIYRHKTKENYRILRKNLKFKASRFIHMRKPRTISMEDQRNKYIINKVWNYKRLNILLRKKLYDFLVRFALLKAQTTNNKEKLILHLELNTLLSKYYHRLNIYKLYKSNDSKLLNAPDFLINKDKIKNNMPANNEIKQYNISHLSRKNLTSVFKGKLNKSTHKLNNLYKLFTFYSKTNITIPSRVISSSSLQGKQETREAMKTIWNLYKLLKKSQISPSTKGYMLNIAPRRENKKNLTLESSKAKNINIPSYKTKDDLNLVKKTYSLRGKTNNLFRKRKNLMITRDINKKTLNKPSFSLDFNRKNLTKAIAWKKKRSLSYLGNNKSVNSSLKKVINNISLIKRINKIERFFKKYKKIILKKSILKGNSLPNVSLESGTNNSILQVTEKNIIDIYKLNFIKQILHKDLLYLYYIKLLSFNNIVFKNWFLNSLKNILSKIYNKKVVFNIINLKYIHLNTDIFSQAIAVRLRNFKKNKLTKVLRKALKLVVLSKVNSYNYDIHSPVYKYIESHFNNFKNLNKELFTNNIGELPQLLGAEASKKENSSTDIFIPKDIRHLSQVQASTVNFIKYKSVFGVRLEASGRLTKRSTASRAVFKFRYKGSLKNNPMLSRTTSSDILNNNRISNIQYTKISSKTRNGSFGLKGWINNN